MKNSIVTKTGDDGMTYLFGEGIRVKKSHLRVKSYGELDNLNSLLGLIVTTSSIDIVNNILVEIQNQLFEFGSDIAIPSKIYQNKFTNEKHKLFLSYIKFVEEKIVFYESNLSELKNFILPGGCLEASYLHLARTDCRRVERCIVEVMESEEIHKSVLIYFNRLSDLFFTLARVSNFTQGINEAIWISKLKNS